MEFNKYLIFLVFEDIDRRVLIIWIMCLFLLVFMKELQNNCRVGILFDFVKCRRRFVMIFDFEYCND